MPVLRYLIPHTAVGNSAGQLFLALQSFHFSSLAFTQSKCNVNDAIGWSFQHHGWEQQRLAPRQEAMCSWPNVAEGKLSLAPDLPTTTQGLTRSPSCTCGWQRTMCWEGLAGCAGTGAASIHTFPPVSQLLTFTSFTLPGLVCSRRALNYTLISFGNWVTGIESGIRTAVTCRHKVLQFLPPRSPPAQSPSAKPHATGCWEKLLPDFTV